MSLLPTATELVARARADLRMGLPVVLCAADSCALVAAAETLQPARLADLRAVGEVVLAITARRADTLKARAYDGDIARVALPDDADAGWVAAMADPALDMATPLKGPHATLRAGDADLHRAALRLMKSAHLLPAALVVETANLPEALTRLDLTILGPLMDEAATLGPVAAARVPLAATRAGRVHVFRPGDGGEEHYAVEIGRPARDAPVLARLHSACFTGDVLGSLKCDCGAQLQAALAQMAEAGAGVLLYLNQEGRGIGLANKMRAYALQDQGFDTVEANHRLGFEDDERDFRIGASILAEMGFSQVRLMTNNPAKVAMLESCGLKVTERVPLRVGENPLNQGYLETKARKSGHIL